MSTTSRHFWNVILQQLDSSVDDTSTPSSNAPPNCDHVSPLARLKGRAAEQARSTMLTLHFMFPHELLPALDLLDRRLVNKFRCPYGDDPSSALEMFYVQSASAVTDPINRRSANSRFRNAWSATKVHYEVRLDAWNCTCAAFAQSQLKLLLREPRHEEEPAVLDPSNGTTRPGNRFGGIATKTDSVVPTCKHILAVVMAEAAPRLLGAGVQTRDISVQEMAAWSAGWGEG